MNFERVELGRTISLKDASLREYTLSSRLKPRKNNFRLSTYTNSSFTNEKKLLLNHIFKSKIKDEL